MIDVVYARQDIGEDVNAGVKDMAVLSRNSMRFLPYILSYGSTESLLAAGWRQVWVFRLLSYLFGALLGV